jgi:polyphosphate kinase
MNALLEPSVIEALYQASQAGVEVDMIVRGLSILRPGVKGLSENIRVRSIVGRFLEHSRIFHFANGGNSEIYLGSADWMPRNLFERCEVVFPVRDQAAIDRIHDEILPAYLADTGKTDPDAIPKPGAKPSPEKPRPPKPSEPKPAAKPAKTKAAD